jgi:hypothetical protein
VDCSSFCYSILFIVENVKNSYPCDIHDRISVIYNISAIVAIIKRKKNLVEFPLLKRIIIWRAIIYCVPKFYNY